MIHPSRLETNQLRSDRGTMDVCVCYLSVAFTSCDTIMADYNNIDDIRKQKKEEYNRQYTKVKEGGYNKRYRLKQKA